jgi:hypothetical protein
MAVEFNVTSCKLGVTLQCSGETADLATDIEINEAVKRIRSKLDQAAYEAKAAVRAEKARGVHS